MTPTPCVLVVGTPRSGTSCVAGVLHHLGVRMTLRDFPPPHPINPAGFFEDRDLLAALEAANDWVTATYLADVHRQLAAKLAAVSRLADLLAERAAPGVLWGCKSLLAADGAFRRAYGGPVRVVRTTRDPAGIAASARAATGGPRDVAAMVARADACVTAIAAPTLVVPYEGLTADPAGWVAAVAGFVGVPPTPAAAAHVDPAMRHH